VGKTSGFSSFFCRDGSKKSPGFVDLGYWIQSNPVAFVNIADGKLVSQLF
tara:strand:- start:222 stop:371 length:150 start_codon:yes stop_codon:yes gene_type:complete